MLKTHKATGPTWSTYRAQRIRRCSLRIFSKCLESNSIDSPSLALQSQKLCWRALAVSRLSSLFHYLTPARSQLIKQIQSRSPGENAIMSQTQPPQADFVSELPAWPLAGVGAVVLIGVSAIMLDSDAHSLPVAIPAMIVGSGAASLIPPALFLMYNFFVLGFSLNRVSTPAIIITALFTLATAALSAWGHIEGWSFVGTYTDFPEAVFWSTMNALLAAATGALVWQTARKKSPAWTLLAHLLLFCWIFSFAFPWWGEMI